MHRLQIPWAVFGTWFGIIGEKQRLLFFVDFHSDYDTQFCKKILYMKLPEAVSFFEN